MKGTHISVLGRPHLGSGRVSKKKIMQEVRGKKKSSTVPAGKQREIELRD